MSIDKAKIIERAKKYVNQLPKQKFVSGETYITPAGQVSDGEEAALLVDVALSGRFAEGKYGKQLDKDIRQFFDNQIRFTSLCNSGSSANFLALTAITAEEFGTKRAMPGDEVITVAAGFPTTVNPIIQNKLVPVFVDVTIGTYVPDPVHIEEMITPKTKAIMLAHPLGNPFDAKAIRDVADEYDLFMIEDCADALGAKFDGKWVGTYGDLATTSFYPAHHITGGEGGMVFTDSPMLDKVVKSFRDWGRACFPAGTMINVKERFVPIEQVKVGDSVLTHEGTYQPVIETFQRKFTGELIRIKPSNLPEIRCTPEHPFLVWRDSDWQWILAKDLVVGDRLMEFTPRSDAQHDKINIAYQTAYKHVVDTYMLDADLFRLCGYWLAEGSLASGLKGKSGYTENKYKFYRVDFAFHIDETELVADVQSLMKKYFGSSMSSRTQKNAPNSISLSFKSRKGYEFFKQLFGIHAWNKSLPPWMVTHYNLDELSQLIRGFMLGDGYVNWQKANISSCSYELINQVRRIALRMGCVPSLSVNSSYSSVEINRSRVHRRHTLYSLDFYGKHAQSLLKRFGIEFLAKSNRSCSYQIDSKTVYKIREIERIPVEDMSVYNLEVEESHSYHANGIAVHNCWCAPGKDNTCGKRFDWQLGSLPACYDHKYTYSRLGYNLKATEMQAALLCAQLKKLPFFIERRRDNWQKLHDGLLEMGADRFFILPRATKNSEPSWFGFCLTVKESADFSRNDIIQFLENHKIGTRLLFGGNLLKQPAYKDVVHRVHDQLWGSDVVMRSTFWVGCAPHIDDIMLEYILSVFQDFLKGR